VLNHTPVNDWQRGLLKLFGYIDPLFWTLLWALARNADDKGHVRMWNTEISDATVRAHIRFTRWHHGTLRRALRIGLIRVAQVRRYEHQKDERGRVTIVENYPRVLELYAGIRHGKIPAGAEKINGLSPSHFAKGWRVKWSTHKLIRKKFKK